MKKILSSIFLIITAMLLCCGCAAEGAAETAPTYPENYAPEPQNIEPLTIEIKLKGKPQNDPNREYINDRSVRYDGGYIGEVSGYDKYGDSFTKNGFVVKYTFTNKSSTSSYLTRDAGSLEGYQNGVKLPSYDCGPYYEFTEILPGKTIELTKVFLTDDYSEPVELVSESWGCTYLHTKVTPNTLVKNKTVSTPYTIEFKGAGTTDSGNIVVDHSFTNTADSSVSPAHIYAVQAYQGKERLGIVNESKDGDGLYIKFFKAEPGQTVDLSTTFELKNREEEVTVYLTVPATAEIFAKQVYKVK